MNRFQRQLEVAMQAINQLQDEHTIVRYELRDALAETKRVLYMYYGRERRGYADVLKQAGHTVENVAEFKSLDDSINEVGAVDRAIADLARAKRNWQQEQTNYFDVTTWLWTSTIDLRPKLALEEAYPR